MQKFKNCNDLMNDLRLIKSVLNECFTIKDIQDKTSLDPRRIQKIIKHFNLTPAEKRFCLKCSKELKHNGNRPPKFCSSTCKDSWLYRNQKSTCVICGKEIDGDRKYCSVECRNSVEVSCIRCGTTFISNSKGKYCEECKHDLEVERITNTETRTCVICGEGFKDSKNSNNTTCCLACKKEYITIKLKDEVLMNVYSSTDPEQIKLETREKIKWIDV